MLRLATTAGRLQITAVVSDMDRTLTDARGRFVPAALQAFRRLRRAHVRTFLASGRRPAEFRRRRATLQGAFDGYVLEGGALIGTLDRLRPWKNGDGPVAPFARWLEAEGVAFDTGHSIVSFDRSQQRKIRRYPGLVRLAVHVNRDRCDVTPAGVDKGTGTRRLLSDFFPRGRPRVLAIGDGENDLPLFHYADYAVAVANASPTVRSTADEVTRFPRGRGVADFLHRRLLGQQLPASPPAQGFCASTA